MTAWKMRGVSLRFFDGEDSGVFNRVVLDR